MVIYDTANIAGRIKDGDLKPKNILYPLLALLTRCVDVVVGIIPLHSRDLIGDLRDQAQTVKRILVDEEGRRRLEEEVKRQVLEEVSELWSKADSLEQALNVHLLPDFFNYMLSSLRTLEVNVCTYAELKGMINGFLGRAKRTAATGILYIVEDEWPKMSDSMRRTFLDLAGRGVRGEPENAVADYEKYVYPFFDYARKLGFKALVIVTADEAFMDLVEVLKARFERTHGVLLSVLDARSTRSYVKLARYSWI